MPAATSSSQEMASAAPFVPSASSGDHPQKTPVPAFPAPVGPYSEASGRSLPQKSPFHIAPAPGRFVPGASQGSAAPTAFLDDRSHTPPQYHRQYATFSDSSAHRSTDAETDNAGLRADKACSDIFRCSGINGSVAPKNNEGLLHPPPE